jgi:hypothetical protein
LPFCSVHLEVPQFFELFNVPTDKRLALHVTNQSGFENFVGAYY